MQDLNGAKSCADRRSITEAARRSSTLTSNALTAWVAKIKFIIDALPISGGSGASRCRTMHCDVALLSTMTPLPLSHFRHCERQTRSNGSLVVAVEEFAGDSANVHGFT